MPDFSDILSSVLPDADPPSDGALMIRAREGDTLAFEELVRRHHDRLVRHATRFLGEQTSAQDCVQQAWLSVWRGLPSFKGDAAFSTWVFRIVHNSCTDAVRRSANRAREGGLENTQATVPSPEHHVLTTDLHLAVGRCLRAMPHELAHPWVLRELDGLSYAEIASLTATSLQTTRGRLQRARARMADEMRAWR